MPKKYHVTPVFLFFILAIGYYVLRVTLKTRNFPSVENFVSNFQNENKISQLKRSSGYSVAKMKNLEDYCFKLMEPNVSDIFTRSAIDFDNHQLSYNLPSGKFPGCRRYKSERLDPLIDAPINEVERSFPVAFGILVYKNFEQTEQLFRAIYRPQNFYCFHIDKTANSTFRNIMRKLISCFPNVIEASSPLDVVWGEHSVLLAELRCMADLLGLSGAWKYYINLTGEEFPLVTNLELVSVLRELKGANIIDGGFKDVMEDRLPTTMPFNLKKYKGSTHVFLNRKAVDFMINDRNISETLLNNLAPLRSTCEAYFAVLQFNPEVNLPGGMTERPESRLYKVPSVPRHKEWSITEAGEFPCISGFIKRQICMLGVKHLPILTRKSYGARLVANKFPWTFQPLAYDCMQVWHHSKVEQEYKTGKIAMNISKIVNSSYMKYTRPVEGY